MKHRFIIYDFLASYPLLLLFVVVIFIVLSFFSGFFLSDKVALFFVDDKALYLAYQKKQLENEQLLRENYQYKSERHIQQQSIYLLKQQILALNEKIDTLDKELKFYKGVVVDSRNTTGIYFQHVSLVRAMEIPEFIARKYPHKQVYVYSLTLVNKMKTKRYRRGKINFELISDDEQQISDFLLLDLNFNKKNLLKIRFQYFGKFDGYLLLDKKYQLDRVVVAYEDSLNKKIKIRTHIENINQVSL